MRLRPGLPSFGWIAARGDAPGPVFTRLDPGAKGLERLTGDSVNRVVGKIGLNAGLKRRARAHGLHHQGITRALDLTNGNVRMVQGLGRHADPRTLMKYDDARRDDAGTLAQMLGNDQTGVNDFGFPGCNIPRNIVMRMPRTTIRHLMVIVLLIAMVTWAGITAQRTLSNKSRFHTHFHDESTPERSRWSLQPDPRMDSLLARLLANASRSALGLAL